MNRSLALASIVLGLAAPLAAQSTPTESAGSLALYRASLVAAEASLRLHETATAREFLDLAPAALRGWEWRYLEARSDESTRAVAAHEGPAFAVDLSPDGKRLATCGRDGAVKLWDAVTGSAVATLAGHGGPVWSVRFAPDGRSLASASSDGTVRLWDLASGAELRRFEGVGRGIAAVAFSPDGRRLVASSWRWTQERGVFGVVVAWELGEGKELFTIEHGVKPIVAVDWSRDSRWIAAGTWDADVALIDPEAKTEVAKLAPPESEAYQAVQSVAFSSDGARLAVAAKDGRVRLWDVASRTLATTLVGQAEGQSRWINGVAFLADGRLAAAGADGTLRIWDAGAAREVAVLHGHLRPVIGVVASRDAGRLYSTGSDGELRVWDLTALAPERRRWKLPDSAYSIAFSPDGARAAVSGWGGYTKLFATADGKELRTKDDAHGQSGVATAWSSDGQWIATTGNDGRALLWNAESGEPVALLVSAKRQIASVAFSPDGKYVAVPAGATEVRVLEVPSGAPWALLDHPEGDDPWQVAFSADGTKLAVGTASGAVSVWDWATSNLLYRVEPGPGRAAVAFSPDGATLAVGSGNGALTFWNATTGELLRRGSGHQQALQTLAFSPDGRRLASGGADDAVRIWEPASGEELLSLPIGASVWALAWSPDGSRLGVVPLDATVRMLEAPKAH